MGRRAKPSKKDAEAKRPPAGKPPKNDDARVRDLEKRLAESLEREKAAGEILRVISSSPTDLQPVLDALAESATRLCASYDANIFRLDGDVLRLVAHHGPLIVPLGHVVSATRGSVTGRAVLDRQTVQAADLQTEVDEFPDSSPTAQKFGYRTTLGVPLLREGKAIGAISLRRTEVQPFTDDDIALLQTFADQAVIAIENVRLFKDLEARNADLRETLAQQTATADILRAISASPTDYQPVFDAIVRNAGSVCGAVDALLWRIDGDELVVRAHHGPIPRTIGARQPLQGSVAGRAVSEARVVHIEDVTQADEFPIGRDLARRLGWRTTLSVPLLREGTAIGAILIRRSDVRLFTAQEIALLQTFADQAVIAIENVRLFTELQTSNHELTTALDTQTATSDILRVISRSQTDVQPVFDAILSSAVRLLRGYSGAVTRLVGDQIALAAATSSDDAGNAALRRIFPQSFQSETASAQAIRDRAPLNIADAQADPRLPDASHAAARARGFRSLVTVPLLRHDEAVGTIAVMRRESGGFTDDEIALLQTFADQAVIAIENVRLFMELETRNRDLTEALDQQTATSELLKVIGRSTFDLQPVFETLVENARRLCEAERAFVHRFDGQVLRVVATHNVTPELRAFVEQNPFPVGRDTVMALSGLERRTIHIHDVQSDPEITYPGNVIEPVRTALAVPMLRAAELLGVMMVYRHEVRPFSDGQIALLETFADQAAIAIENARLLSELQTRTQDLIRSVEQLTALGDVGRAVSSSLDLDTVLTTIVGRAVQLSGTDGGTIFEYDEGAEEFSPRATLNADESQSALLRATRLRRGEGAVGQMAVTREPLQIPDIAAEGAYESRLRGALLEAGTRAVLAIPLLHEERIVGGLVVTRRTPGAFATEIVEILRTFATQSALAIQNARLFREIERKSRELEVASQHKSEFLANMSHELRTPLNAIIGYSELLEEEAGDLDGGRLVPDLQKIAVAAKHQLSLINDILDLSKVEAGRMELERSAFDLPAAIDDAMLLMRERASRRGITLERHVDGGVGEIRADERKVKQVLLNLLSNAVKFTPAGGRIEVRAAIADGDAEIAVTDTGSGIAPEDHDAVFEEFRQVGRADKKVEGTGLGLALSRKFVELHGGRIWVRSQVGQGSTFTFTLPVRPQKEIEA